MSIYILLINIIGFIAMWADKQKAKKHKWRIRESYFFYISLLGGSLGAWMGMYIFHHKTHKWYFILGIPLIFILQVTLYLMLKNF